MNTFAIRPALKSAISWSIMAEVIRRHGDRENIRLLETHPGGGQYDCLSVFRLRDTARGVYETGNAIHLGDLNRIGGFHSFADTSAKPFAWLEEWLVSEDPVNIVDYICRLLGFGLESNVPATSRHTFSIRLISAIVGARALGRDWLDARMAYDDSSGMAGSGMLRDAGAFPALLGSGRPEGNMSTNEATECWLFYESNEKRLVGALRTDGQFSSASDPTKTYDLYPSYKREHRIQPVLCEALSIISG